MIRKTDSRHHHHPEGVVYRGFCLNSGTVAVSKFPFRWWWWCIESVFPMIRILRSAASSCSRSSGAPRPCASSWSGIPTMLYYIILYYIICIHIYIYIYYRYIHTHNACMHIYIYIYIIYVYRERERERENMVEINCV